MFASGKNIPGRYSPAKYKYKYSLALFVITFIFTFSQYGFNYLNYDDPWVFVQNTRLHADSISDILSLVKPEVRYGVVEYMPVKDISLALDYYLFGLDSPFVRLQNFFWYALSAVFCFLFVARLGKEFVIRNNLKITEKIILFLSFLFALAFVFHPAHVNSWAWISSRKDLLSGCFVFLSLWTYYVFRLKAKKSFLIISVTAYLLALLSKPTSAFLPLVLFALELLYVDLSEVFKTKTLKKLFWPSILSLITVLFAAFYYQVVTSGDSPGVMNVSENVVVAPYGYLPLWIVQIAAYLKMVFSPYGLLVVQLFDFPEILSFSFLISALLVLILIAAFVLGISKNRLVAFGVLFFIFSLLPTMATNPFIQYWATRYLFFGVFGILLIFYALILTYEAISIRSFVIITLLVLLMGVTGFVSSKNFRDSESFWKYHISVKPNHWIAYKELGDLLDSKGQHEKALEYFMLCNHFNPHSLHCAISMNQLQFDLLPANEKKQAVEAMLKLEQKDTTGEVLRKLAPMYLELGERELALKTYAKGMEGHQLDMQDVILYAKFLWLAGEKELAFKNLDIADSIRKSWQPDTSKIRKIWIEETHKQQ